MVKELVVEEGKLISIHASGLAMDQDSHCCGTLDIDQLFAGGNDRWKKKIKSVNNTNISVAINYIFSNINKMWVKYFL